MNIFCSPKGMKRGFTLIEIMLALLVVSIGIVAVSGLLGSSLDTSAKSHDDLHVVSFADMVLNYYHSSTNWNEIPPDGPWTVPGYDGTPVDLASSLYTCRVLNSDADIYTVSFELIAEAPADNIKVLTLRVWPGYGTNSTPRMFHTEIYNWKKN